jgi:hypothetical protein
MTGMTDQELQTLLTQRSHLVDVVRNIAEGSVTNPIKYAEKVIKRIDKANGDDS